MWKKLICRLFHKVEISKDSIPFTDVVAGDQVNFYWCPKCKKEFMALKPRDWFRVYVDN